MKLVLVIGLFLLLFNLLSLREAQAATWRRAIELTNSGAALTNYQVLVPLDTAALVAADKMRGDGADLRVTDAQNDPAPFWVEPGTINTTNTRIWVKAPMLQALGHTTLYLWYGGDQTNSAASFDDTFTKDFEDEGASGIWHLDGDALDASGNDNHGTPNGPTWQGTDGGGWGSLTNVLFADGSHLYFDGNDDIVSFPNSATLDLTNSLSMECWMKISSWANYRRIFVKGQYPTYSPQWQYAIWMMTDGDDIGFSIGPSSGQVDAVTTGNRCVPNVWYHVAGTYDADTGAMKIYVNGELAGTNSIQGLSIVSVPVGPSLGAQANNGYEHFHGYLDEARIYSRCLPAGEVKAHAERRKYAAQEPVAAVGPEELDEGWARLMGRITDSATGEGVAGIRLEFSDASSTFTGPGGWYTNYVPVGWSGTVTPSYVCGTFAPDSRAYDDVRVDQMGQDYELQDLSAPGEFSLLSPTGGAVEINGALLTWETSACAAEYEVYLGTTADPALVAVVQTNQWPWPGEGFGTQRWYVVAKNAVGANRAPETGTWSFVHYQSVSLPGNVTIAATNYTYDNKVLIKNGGQLTVQGVHTFAQLILTNGATGVLNGACSAMEVHVTGGSRLTHAAATTTNEYRLDLAVNGTLRVDADSAIDVSGKGYLSGRTHPNTTTNASSNYSGGSYGGLGGKNGPGNVNPVYGDFRYPNEVGSGGAYVGVGGGLARITAGTLELNGSIMATGTTHGGSGGGVYLDVGTISGTGLIEAKGAFSSWGGGGGGASRFTTGRTRPSI